MELVRQWLLGVVGAALVAALADGLMPNGAVKRVGKLVCALVLLCALLRPVLKLEMPDLTYAVGNSVGETERQRAQLEQRSGAVLKTLIERQSAAYIVDKAAQLGVDGRVRVVCRAGEGGSWMPGEIYVTGQTDAGQRELLTAIVRDEFGLIPEFRPNAGGE